jgi:hypothetical protein
VAELLKKRSDIDWGRVDWLVERFKCRRSLLLGLALAERLFEVDMPLALEREVTYDRGEKTVERKIAQGMLEGEKGGSFLKLRLAMCDSVVDQIRYFFRFLLLPTKADWKAIALPGYLLFIYYVFRPVRLGWEFGKQKLTS